jgi:uncharacterized membrane protein
VNRIDRLLLIAGALVVLVAPIAFFVRGAWPWRVHGLFVTDVLGFGMLGVAVARGVWRAERARRRARIAQAELADAKARVEAILRRRGDPKGRMLS